MPTLPKECRPGGPIPCVCWLWAVNMDSGIGLDQTCVGSTQWIVGSAFLGVHLNPTCINVLPSVIEEQQHKQHRNNIETTSCNSRNNIETTTQTTAETTAETATQWLWAVSSGLWVQIFGWLRLSSQKFPHQVRCSSLRHSMCQLFCFPYS